MRTEIGLSEYLCKPLECGTVFGLNVPPGGIHHLPARYDDEIDACNRLSAPKQLANEPFRPVPDDRVSNFLARRNPEAGRPDLVGEGEAGHEPAPKARAMVVDARKLRPSAQFHRDEETVSRFRPFARRRLRTVRPFLVCMRTRKP